jgi:glycosidase
MRTVHSPRLAATLATTALLACGGAVLPAESPTTPQTGAPRAPQAAASAAPAIDEPAIVPPSTQADWSDQVFYHVFVRSFFDSNGDGHGDLDGIRQKLDYVQRLGATAIWLSPIASSRSYHNYWPNDLGGIDARYGTVESLRALNREVHRRGMRILLDMETQYVGEDHPWWVAAQKNPRAPEQRFILCRPPHVDLCWPNSDISYDGVARRIVRLDLRHPDMVALQHQVYRRWLDPDGDGDLADGVDGYRIDHVMDDLDDDGGQTETILRFWKPLIEDARKVNPRAYFLGEQAAWERPRGDHYGDKALSVGGFDGVFGFPLREAILTGDPKRIHAEVEATFRHAGAGKQVFVFLENHDTPRLRSAVNEHVELARTLGALGLLLPGVPELYYGQELGARGQKTVWRIAQGGPVFIPQLGETVRAEKLSTDGDDIPTREAFKWTKDASAPGTARWYAGTGPWWTQSSLHDDTQASYEEQRRDPRSFFHHYRRLVHLRRGSVALRRGTYVPVQGDRPEVLAFVRDGRKDGHGERVLVIANLSPAATSVRLEVSEALRGAEWSAALAELGGDAPANLAAPVALEAFGLRILRAQD